MRVLLGIGFGVIALGCAGVATPVCLSETAEAIANLSREDVMQVENMVSASQ